MTARLAGACLLTACVAFTIGLRYGHRTLAEQLHQLIQVNDFLRMRLATAERDPDHLTCRHVERKLNAEIADFEIRLAVYQQTVEDQGGVTAEAERILRRGEAGS